MNDLVKITLNLTVICALAGLLISATWSVTDPVRVRKEAQEREMALKGLIPSADKITQAREVVIGDKKQDIYVATSGGKTIGYIVSSVGRGYSSLIKLLVATGTDNTVTGIEVLGHAETPGLGDQITEAKFKDRFKGKVLDNLVVVKQPTDTQIEAISGATISSRAVTKGVKAAVETLAAERVKGGLDGPAPLPVETPAPAPSNPGK